MSHANLVSQTDSQGQQSCPNGQPSDGNRDRHDLRQNGSFSPILWSPSTSSQAPLILHEPPPRMPSAMHKYGRGRGSISGLSDISVNGWNYTLTSFSSDEDGHVEDRQSRMQKFLHVLVMAQSSITQHILGLQVALLVISITLAAMVFMPLSLAFAGFNNQCLLFADLKLNWMTNNTVVVDTSKSQYGSIDDCDECTFTAVVVAIACFIFLWFYLCNILFTETKQSTSMIQIPALLIFIGLFFAVTIAASKISEGFSAWCDNLVMNVPPSGQSMECWEFEKLDWNNLGTYQFYTRYLLAEVSGWLLCFVMFVLAVISGAGSYQALKISNEELTKSSSEDTIASSLPVSEHVVVVNEGCLAPLIEETKDASNNNCTARDGAEETVKSDKEDSNKLLQTEVIVHSAPSDSKDGQVPPSNDGNFSEEDKNTSGINTSSDKDKTPLLSYQNDDVKLSPTSRKSDEGDSEKQGLTQKSPPGLGYGAVAER